VALPPFVDSIAFGRVYLHGTGTKAVAGGNKRTMSAAARQKISLAQKARWAKRKGTPKRTTSQRQDAGELENRGGAESTVGKNEGREEFVIRRPGVKCGVVLTRR